MNSDISVCIITKNEETRLERCLSSLIPFGFEIVIVDTGSTDQTREIASKFTDKIYNFEWCDDFSAARNYSLQMASNDWIFMMDSDEWVENLDIEELRYFMKKLPLAMGAVNRNNQNGTPENPSYSTDRTERFFNRKKYNYSGTIHEQLTPKYNFEVQCLLLNATIGHDGYCMSDEMRRVKAERNISMLLSALTQNPDDPYVLYQLGKGYDIISDYDKAISYYKKSLSNNLDFSLAYVQALFTCCLEDMLQLGLSAEALSLLNSYPEISDSADYYYIRGLVLYENDMNAEAIASLKKAKTIDFATRTGANTFLAQAMIEKISSALCSDTNNIPFSICFIAKNEEKNLDAFLTAIENTFAGVKYEIVAVDTGSTDSSIEIIRKHGIEPYSFNWVNDFSAARNFSIKKASNNYVLILDCDEIVTGIDIKTICDFILNSSNSIGTLSRANHYIANGTDTIYTDHVERFFDRTLYTYNGVIHEQVVPINPGTRVNLIPIGISVDHNGYNLSEEEIKAKAARNNALLFEELKKNPNDPYIYFQIGQSYNMLHDDVNANYYYGKGLELDVDPSLEYVQMMVIEYGYTMLHLHQEEAALSYESIYNEFCHSADFLVLMGLIYMRNSQFIKAMQEFLKAISTEESHVEGANTFIPRYNIGLINEMMGQTEDAITLYKSCGNFAPAIDRLNELCQ